MTKIHLHIIHIDDLKKLAFPHNPLEQLKEQKIGKIRVIEGELIKKKTK